MERFEAIQVNEVRQGSVCYSCRCVERMRVYPTGALVFHLELSRAKRRGTGDEAGLLPMCV